MHDYVLTVIELTRGAIVYFIPDLITVLTVLVMEAQKLHISVCSVPIASMLHPTQKPIAPFTGHFSPIKFNL